ncbi:Glucosamine-6-phosphate isomerase (Glucosamine-6-phosphate deaminase) (GNPDA) (GlcN6P deaminase) [Microbotryomycetes sp. JL221]|nr:Glucosamine-6-phosphate isomerase (Glucosamine-6-phosphate deaminase) (GNPDA) (GlcN6P deaminase) [Microbotryomycetes sp. JL221]
MTNGTGFVRLSQAFKIEFASQLLEYATELDDLELAIDITLHHLRNDHHQLLELDRGEGSRLPSNEICDSLDFSRDKFALRGSRRILSVVTTAFSGSEKGQPVKLTEKNIFGMQDRLHVPGSSTSPENNDKLFAILEANTTIGLLRGLQSFTQLVYELPRNRVRRDALFIPQVPLLIEDCPAFPHRAFMLDTSRHFFPVAGESLILAFSSIYFTNARRNELRKAECVSLVASHPKLYKKAAYSQEETYSRSDVLHIQEYANARGISVLLEIDVPGHTASVAKVYPEHVACLDKDHNWPRYSAEPPTGQLRLDHEATQFASEVLESIAQLINGPFLSTGGDEVNQRCYLEDQRTLEEMKRRGNASLDALLSDFVNTVHDRLRVNGKTPVMLLNHELSLGKEVVVTVWISSANVRAVADRGHRIIHAASEYLYLDCGAGGWIGNLPGGSNSWCDPFKSWQKVYSFDPFANVTESQKTLILGGEALLWTEQVDPTNLDSMAWPRAAAAAEVFWTGDSKSRSSKEALPRLHDWR